MRPNPTNRKQQFFLRIHSLSCGGARSGFHPEQNDMTDAEFIFQVPLERSLSFNKTGMMSCTSLGKDDEGSGSRKHPHKDTDDDTGEMRNDGTSSLLLQALLESHQEVFCMLLLRGSWFAREHGMGL